MERVRRYDLAKATGARRLDNGWLRAEGVIARIGIQEYRRGDGTIIRELRLPEEVFRQEVLDGLALAPLTDEHPPTMLDATNTAQYARGHLGERIEVVDGRLVKAPLLVTDAALVEKILDGKQAELSVGYWCDLEHAPGEWRGEKYDCVQRNIVPNHVAITARARGGPELRVRLDTADGVSIGGDSPQDETRKEPKTVTMKKLKIDSAEVEVPEAVANAIEAERAAHVSALAAATASLATVTTERDQAKARADVEKARADAEAGKVEEVRKQERATALAAARTRLELEAKALEILGPDFKLDGVSNVDVRKAVVGKLQPAVKLDGVTDVYVEAAYDLALVQAQGDKGRAGLAAVRGAVGAPPAGVQTPAVHEDSQSLREKRLKASEEAWKSPTVGVKKDDK